MATNASLQFVNPICRFYDILKLEDRCLTEAARDELPELGRNLCSLYAQLSTAAHAAGQRMWTCVPKFHLFQHLCEWQAPEWGNPRFLLVLFRRRCSRNINRSGTFLPPLHNGGNGAIQVVPRLFS